MNNQLAIREHTAPTESEFQILKEQATMLVKTGFLATSINTPEKAMAIILTGRELGIPTMAALNTINVIQQKPTISPQLMLALIERSGQLDDIQITAKQSPDGKNEQIAVTMKRKGRTAHTEIFGTIQATALGLMSKDNYKKQAAVMFRWRAVAACARVVFPDVILGLYTPEEMGAEVIETGEIIEPVPVEVQKNTVVRMPERVESRELKVESKVSAEKSVSPEMKGKLLWGAGYVKRSNIGYEVTDPADGEYFEITKVGKVVRCNCSAYIDSANHGAENFQCAHIQAVKFFAANQQKAAA